MPKTYGPYISKVTLPSGNTYDIKDEEAVYVIVDDDLELDAVAGVFRKLLSEDGIDLDI